MRLLGGVCLFLGVVALVAEAYLLFVSLSFRKSNCISCTGYLKQQKRKKHVIVGRRYYETYLEYVYTYCVNEKEYKISGGLHVKRGRIPPNRYGDLSKKQSQIFLYSESDLSDLSYPICAYASDYGDFYHLRSDDYLD